MIAPLRGLRARGGPADAERLLWPWLVGLLLLVPSANYQVFSGVPWNTTAKLAAIALTVPLLLGGRLRRAYRTATPNRGVLGRRTVCAACCLGLLGKLALLTFGGYEGFLGFYRSPAARPVSGAWEKSYTDPLRRFGATRIDRKLEFDPPNWNLSFVNSLRFNVLPWVKRSPSRSWLPLEAEWVGRVEAREGRRLAITYAGEGRVEIDGAATTLPKKYGGVNEVVLAVPPGEHRVRIFYVFDDGYRATDPLPAGPYATFRCRWQNGDGGAGQAFSARSAPVPWRAAAALVDGLVLLVLASVLRFYLVLFRRDWPLLILIAALGPLIEWIPIADAGFSGGVGFLIAAGILLLALGKWPTWRSVLLAYVGILYLTAFRPGFEPKYAQTVLYKTEGNDWLSYDSFARSILDTGSLEAGESVFSHQPLSRYVTFLLHILFGDGDVPIAAAYLVTLNWGIFWLYWRFRARTRISGVRVGRTVAAILLLALAASDPVVSLARLGASEVVCWVAFVLWFPMLFDSRRARDWIVAGLLIGLSVDVRSNHVLALLAAFLIFAIHALRARPVAAAGASAAALGVALLPAWHNWYFGHQFVLFTYTYALNTVVEPASLLRLGSDVPARSTLWTQLEGLFYFRPRDSVFGDSLALRATFHGLQIVWASVSVAAFVRRRAVALPARALLLLPLLYMIPHVFFFVTIYYPRHIISPHLAMGVVTLFALREWGQGAARNSGAVEQRRKD